MPRSLCLLTICLTLSACAPKVYDDPLAVMTNRTIDPSVRMKAAAQAQRDSPRDPRRIAALHQLIWERGYPIEQRRYAIDELIRIDEAEFRRVAGRRIVLLDNWEVLEYLFKLAVESALDYEPLSGRELSGLKQRIKGVEPIFRA